MIETVRRELLSWGLAAACCGVLCGPVGADTQRTVPISAPRQIIYEPIGITTDDGPVQLTVPLEVALSDPSSDASPPQRGSYYPFPNFLLTEAEVRYGGEDPVPLIGFDGRLNPPGVTDPSIEVQLQVTDLLYDDQHRDAIYAELAASKAAATRDEVDPELQPDWTASLQVRNGLGGWDELAAYHFSRNPSRGQISMKFDIEPFTDPARTQRNHAYDSLLGVNPDTGESDSGFRAGETDLQLVITGQYSATFFQTDIMFTAQFMDEEVTQLINDLTSRSGTQTADLFVPVPTSSSASGIFQKFDEESEFKALIDARLAHRQGYTPDPGLLQSLLTDSLDLFKSQINLTQQDPSKVVSFLMSNGLTVTTPINHLTDVQNFNSHATTASTEQMLNEMARNNNSGSISAAASVFGIGWGGSGSFSDSWNNLSESQKQEASKEFNNETGTVQQALQGDIKSVASMDAQQAAQYKSKGYYRIDFIGETFKEGFADFSSGLPFDRQDDPTLYRGKPLVDPDFRNALAQLVEAARTGFVGSAVGDPQDGSFVSKYGLPLDTRFLAPRIRLVSPADASEPASWWVSTVPSRDPNANDSFNELYCHGRR